MAERYGQRLNSEDRLPIRWRPLLHRSSGGNRFADWDLKKELPYQGVFLLKDGSSVARRDLDRQTGSPCRPMSFCRQRLRQAHDHALQCSAMALSAPANCSRT